MSSENLNTVEVESVESVPQEEQTEKPDVETATLGEASYTKLEEHEVTQEGSFIFNRESQDKLGLDVISTIENLLKERQLTIFKNQALNEQVMTGNENIQRLKHDLIKKDHLLQDKTKTIRDLEINLTNSQMSYDQLLEDYKEYQITSNIEYEKISNQLDTEKSKYEKLYEEATKTQAIQNNKIAELEDRIRKLEIENKKYIEQYEKIAKEKGELLKSINDFTEKMAFSFSGKKFEQD